MHDFRYKNGELYCERVKVKEIADKIGTPLYLYSRNTITDHFNKLNKALSPVRHMLCYSLKANANLAVISIMAKMGGGADVASGGELFKARKAGVPPEKIVYAGVGKTEQEIRYALSEKIFMFNVESAGELELIDSIAGKIDKQARVALRINPDIDVETHPYIKTGRSRDKFGIGLRAASEIFKKRRSYKNVSISGIHIHIGSQIVTTEPFAEALGKAMEFIKGLEGGEINSINIGGGLGAIYKEEEPSSADAFAKAILPTIQKTDYLLIIEPGRFIMANAGILVTKVLYLKERAGRSFVIVDAGMNDLIRPTLYGSYHQIKPVMLSKKPEVRVYDVVGPICESGDFFARERELPSPISPAEFLAIFTAGAYGFSMASNYNGRPSPPEVLVEGNKYRVVREREGYEDLIRGEG